MNDCSKNVGHIKRDQKDVKQKNNIRHLIPMTNDAVDKSLHVRCALFPVVFFHAKMRGWMEAKGTAAKKPSIGADRRVCLVEVS